MPGRLGTTEAKVKLLRILVRLYREGLLDAGELREAIERIRAATRQRLVSVASWIAERVSARDPGRAAEVLEAVAWSLPTVEDVCSDLLGLLDSCPGLEGVYRKYCGGG